MKALLLAAGLGTRLRPITNAIPKCLVPLNNKPLLYYWLAMLVDSGVDSILINLHHHAQKVQKYIEDSEFSKYVTCVYEEKLLGTGGTIVKNKEFFGDEPAIIVHADNFCVCNFKEFMDSHKNRPKNTEVTMMTFCTDEPRSCGIVKLDSENVVKEFYEKVSSPPSNLANAAVYIIEPSVIKHIERMNKDFVEFTVDVLPDYMNRVFAWHNSVYHIDIGTPKALKQAQENINNYL